MLNPFKKKESEFKLDNVSLPTLSDENNMASGSSNNNSVEDFGSVPNNDFTNNQSNGNFNPVSNNFENQENQFTNTSANDYSNQSNLGIGSSSIGTSFDMQNQQSSQNIQQTPQVEMNLSNNDFTKVKLETIEAKINLVDVRLSSIEQKLDLLTKLILEEVSENTKRKLNVNDMMDKIKGANS